MKNYFSEKNFKKFQKNSKNLKNIKKFKKFQKIQNSKKIFFKISLLLNTYRAPKFDTLKFNFK